VKTISMTYTRVADAIQSCFDNYTGDSTLAIGVAESTIMLHQDGPEMPVAHIHQMSGGHVDVEYDETLFEFDEPTPAVDMDDDYCEAYEE